MYTSEMQMHVRDYGRIDGVETAHRQTPELQMFCLSDLFTFARGLAPRVAEQIRKEERWHWSKHDRAKGQNAYVTGFTAGYIDALLDEEGEDSDGDTTLAFVSEHGEFTITLARMYKPSEPRKKYLACAIDKRGLQGEGVYSTSATNAMRRATELLEQALGLIPA